MPRIFIISGTILVLFACTSDKKPDRSYTNQSTNNQSGEEPVKELDGPTPSSSEKGGRATLAQGANTAFGLSIPRGMTPAPGPPKVYRFEGGYSVKRVTNSIRDQVSVRKIVEEGSGFLIRNATVKAPKGETDGNDLLAIRVYKGQKGGATIDIWLEREYTRNLPKQASSSSLTSAYSKGGSTGRTTRMTSKAKRKRNQSRRETFRVMNKVISGNTLDSNDMNSPFFE